MAQVEARTAEMAGKVISGQAEDDIRAALRNLLEEMGAARAAQLSFAGGDEADMVIEEWSVVIETKSKGVNDFSAPGSGSRVGETAFEQLGRYHNHLDGLPEYTQQKGNWLGVITNGRRWSTRIWSDQGAAELASDREFLPGNEAALIEWLSNLLIDRRKYQPFPSDPGEVFNPFANELLTMTQTDWPNSQEKSYATQKDLWLEILEGSGMGVVTDEEALFRRHCFLVSLARAVEASMEKNPPPVLDSNRMVGFSSWVAETNDGREWLDKMYKQVLSYDWQNTGRDALREVYETTIDKRNRHAFGEYYTPGWVAAMVVERVLDDDWLRRCLTAEESPQPGYGVLDPACGSGTFLYHAAKRIYSYLNTAPDASRLLDVQKADIVANLVVGIDIHPVAVELAKITLLTAFPPGVSPRRGKDALRVFQGDALLADWQTHALFRNPELEGELYEFESPQGREYFIPRFFALRPEFGQQIKTMLDAVIRGDELPLHLLEGDEKLDQLLLESYDTLKTLVQVEQNGVWAWRIFNSVSPLLLSLTKVDRIVANPPWVVMSSIQDRRKRVCESLLKDHQLWPGKNLAAKTNLAALFVFRTAVEYLHCKRKGEFACGWVLPWGSLQGENWGFLREKISPETLDLGDVKQPPFTGDISCVWFEGSAITDDKLKNKIANNVSGQIVSRDTDDWSLAQTRLKISATEIPRHEASDYYDGHKSPFRQGASLVPHTLVKIQESRPSPSGNDRLLITTAASVKGIWANIAPRQDQEIPKRWSKETAGGEHLLPFALRTPFDRFVIPVNSAGTKLIPESASLQEEYWRNANKEYSENAGSGQSTPITLYSRVDYHQKLSSQLSRQDGWIVTYNKSGSRLRSARTNKRRLVLMDQLYWYSATSEEEAGYLVSLINSDYLQVHFRYAKTSWRHFDHNPWRKVPIPKYDPGDATHQKLANLCLDAESIARGFLRSNAARGLGQPATSKLIRAEIVENGLMATIDKQVEKIIP